MMATNADVLGVLARRALDTPGAAAWHYRSRALWHAVDWRSYAEMVAATRAALSENAIRRDSAVIVVARQDPQTLAACLAVRSIGADLLVRPFVDLPALLNRPDPPDWVIFPGAGTAESPADLPSTAGVLLLHPAGEADPGLSWSTVTRAPLEMEPAVLDKWLIATAADSLAQPTGDITAPVAWFGGPQEPAMLDELLDRHLRTGHAGYLTRSAVQAVRDLPVVRPGTLIMDCATAGSVIGEIRSRATETTPPTTSVPMLFAALSVLFGVVAALVGGSGTVLGALLGALGAPAVTALFPISGGQDRSRWHGSSYRLLLAGLAVAAVPLWLLTPDWPSPRLVLVGGGLSTLILLWCRVPRTGRPDLTGAAVRRAFRTTTSATGRRGGRWIAWLLLAAGFVAMAGLRSWSDWARIGLLVAGALLGGAVEIVTGGAVRRRICKRSGLDAVRSLTIVGAPSVDVTDGFAALGLATAHTSGGPSGSPVGPTSTSLKKVHT